MSFETPTERDNLADNRVALWNTGRGIYEAEFVTERTKGMKIIKLSGSNFKKLVAFEIEPSGNLVAVTGPNGAGKTSVLDAIVAAFAGVKGLSARDVDQPIRLGEGQARVVCETEDFTVTRRFTLGRHTVEIRPKNGKAINEPTQAFLDRIVGQIAFDPLAFSEMKDKDLRETLLRVLGLDLEAHDAKINALREDRNELMRRKKEADGVLARATLVPGVPEQEVSVAELSKTLTEAHAVNGRLMELDRQFSAKQEAITAKREEIAKLEAQIKTLSAQCETISQECQQLAAVDTSEIEQKIAAAEDTNKKVRANLAYRAAEKATAELAQKVNDKYQDIQQAEADKSNAIGKAKMPVAGLGIDANGVTLNGVPFRQVNHAKRLEVSMAVGMAMNPELRVMLCNGNGLDRDSLETIARVAQEHDFQLWMEVATDAGEGYGIEIVDGMVQE